jgi:hypothetical protein
MLTLVWFVTDVVVTVKFAVVAPAATVTLLGTVAAAESSESVTTVPPVGAAALNVAVPVEELPPTTVVGLTESAERLGPGGGGGLTVIAANWNTPSRAAESWTVVVWLGYVVTVKLAFVAPAGTTTLAGTLAARD